MLECQAFGLVRDRLLTVDAAPPRLLGAKVRAGEGPVLVDELCIRRMPARHLIVVLS